MAVGILVHILLIKTSSMGDIIHTFPALSDALANLPGTRVDWVVEEIFAQIPYWHPAVDRVIPVALRRWRSALLRSSTYRDWKNFLGELRQSRYEVIIDAQGLVKSGFIASLCSHGVRHGMDRSTLREPLASGCYDFCHHVPRNQHAVERTRQLFALALGYQPPAARGEYAINAQVGEVAAAGGPYWIFLHGSSRANKCWPVACWRKLIELVGDRAGIIKVPWGNQQELQSAQQIAAGFGHVAVLERQSIVELAKVVNGASMVVSVDTGLSHLAAALNRPNVVLYGPTDPNLTAGYGLNQRVIWAEHSKKMADIAPKDVADLLLGDDM